MKVDVKLGDKSIESGIFHDYRYKNDNTGGNSEETIFGLSNISGNSFEVKLGVKAQNKSTGEWQTLWDVYDDIDEIRIKFHGSIENSEFLEMLQLILDAEKMVSIIK